MRRRDVVRDLGPGIYRRLALTIGLSGLFLALLLRRLQDVDPGSVLHAMREIGLLPWMAALAATWVSFRAVAGYDRTLHCHLATGIDPDRAGRAGFSAIAIGQTVGLGVVSGALVRWRMLPELGLAGALRLSVLVALSFLLAWATVCALVLVLFPVPSLAPFAPLVLAGVLLLGGAGLVRPRPWMPNLIVQGRLIGLAAVDCLAAGAALWLLLPGDIGFAPFLAVFLVALGAGLVSGSPAGLGAFEIVLLSLMPGLGQADLLAGVVAWRVAYYALPAIVGAVVALMPAPVRGKGSSPLAPPGLAEAGLAAQGDLAWHAGGFLAGRTRHGLVALADVADLRRFRHAARDEGRWPLLYKAPPRAALRARAAGLVVLPVAREAWLRPLEFRLETPERAGLRRKLRKAAAAGVSCAPEDRPDWDELGAVNAAWRAVRGGEHGFSMGRFAPDYLAGQLVVVARRAGRVVGFASFHRAGSGPGRIWTLDLMRPDPDAPEGTAQALVLAAIEAARSEGVPRLSLAAVPIGSDPAERGVIARLGRTACGQMRGLCQFKEGFAPRWRRLYIAGPSLAALALTGWEIRDCIRNPPPLDRMKPTARLHEDIEIASDAEPWQREGERPA